MTFVIDIARKQWAGAAQPLFADLRLELAPGERCAIMGPSGVGKSSLLLIAAGLDRDFEGVVAARPQPLGVAFQTPRLLPWRTVRENLLICVGEQGGLALELAGELGLRNALDAYPFQISIGMARRAALARALAVEPGFLALDEPFASLDDEAARRARTLVCDRVARSRATLLIVSHDPRADASLWDRVIRLDSAPARIVADTPAAPRVQPLRAPSRRAAP